MIAQQISQTDAANERLRSFIERIERLLTSKAEIAGDIKDVYAEAKANGYDPAIMRQVIAKRKMDANKRQEQESLLDTYLHALGMLATTPLGQAAIARVA